jgi:monofunctional biosynthetic peptidoglycan transglycosylase
MWKFLRHALKLIVLFVIAVIIVYETWIAAQVAWWINHNPQTTAFMEDRLKSLQEKHTQATITHYWLWYDRNSPQLKRAVVAAEDARFMEHNGFVWTGMQTALDKNLKKGRSVAILRETRRDVQVALGSEKLATLLRMG